MKYKGMREGRFISRPNRFIALVEIDGREEVCHVKNTGRCRELFVPGARVFVQEKDELHRKTKFDLITVYKGDMPVNVDSAAPNRVFAEWAKSSGFFGNITCFKPECRYKNSRFDFYVEAEGKKIYIEVKGVTLEQDGVVSFPDAPTERGVKHVLELCDCVKEGYDAYIFFIVQMEQAEYFVPNREKHPAFAEALTTAAKQGVKVRCLTCRVSPDTLFADKFLQVCL